MRNPVHFILDEAAMLGSMGSIDDALSVGRAYGVRMQLYYQSVGQLKKSFPEGQEQTLFSNTSQVFFGVHDNATAEYVSVRLGDETIVVDSGGTSWSDSRQSTSGQQPSESTGYSTTRSHNWSQQARRLLKPEEVMALPQNLAITFTPGVPPVCTKLLRYYEEKRLDKLSRGHSGNVGKMCRAVSQCVAGLLLASVATCITAAVATREQAPPFPNNISSSPNPLLPGAIDVRESQTTLRQPHSGQGGLAGRTGSQDVHARTRQ